MKLSDDNNANNNNNNKISETTVKSNYTFILK
jgi:hypothetical protein